MRDRMKNLKAILAAVSLLFCSLAGANAGLSNHQQDVSFYAPQTLFVHGHAVFNGNRLRSRASSVDTFAVAPAQLAAIVLPVARLAVAMPVFRGDLFLARPESARGPPLS